MKRKLFICIGCLILVSLTACQSGEKLLADTTWEAAKKSKNFEEYVKENASSIDMEILKAEAESAERSISQNLKTAVLLSQLEYQKNLLSEDEINLLYTSQTGNTSVDEFQFRYPDSVHAAEKYLAGVNTSGEEFWKAMDEVVYPYKSLNSLFAAAENLEGETLVNFINGIPDGSAYANQAQKTVDQWIRRNPGKLANVGDELIKADYYKEWELNDFKETYFSNYIYPYLIRVDTAADAVSYLTYLRTNLLPLVESKFSKEELQTLSELTQENYYNTGLAVTIEETLSLKERKEEGLPETIETKGKKVVAFYRNSQSGEYKGSPTELRILGDFMLNLLPEEVPASIEEADYFLVLTPAYQDGEYYQSQSGNETKIKQVYSSTSIDLYDAKTGDFLRHLGNVMEMPPSTILYNLEEEASKYPDLAGADMLTYLYRNINEPDKFITLLDHASGVTSDLQMGESIILDKFEITLRSCKIVKSFQSGYFEYTAEEGKQFVIGNFAVTNRGMETDIFLPISWINEITPIAKVADSKREDFYSYSNSMGVNGTLDSTSLEPGESDEGNVIFEVPEEVALGTEPFSIALFCGVSSVYYAIENP